MQAALAGSAILLCLLASYRLFWSANALRPTDEAAPRRQIDLNRADRSELLQIPGLGPSSADAILAHRAERGAFGSLDELTHVHGIGPKTTEKVKPWLNLSFPNDDEPVEKLERKPVSPPKSMAGKSTKLQALEGMIDVNSASEADLMRLPGIGPTLAGRIVQYRASVPFTRIDDLRKVKGIGAKTLDAIRPFIQVGPRGAATTG